MELTGISIGICPKTFARVFPLFSVMLILLSYILRFPLLFPFPSKNCNLAFLIIWRLDSFFCTCVSSNTSIFQRVMLFFLKDTYFFLNHYTNMCICLHYLPLNRISFTFPSPILSLLPYLFNLTNASLSLSPFSAQVLICFHSHLYFSFLLFYFLFCLLFFAVCSRF